MPRSSDVLRAFPGGFTRGFVAREARKSRLLGIDDQMFGAKKKFPAKGVCD
jgi:hypothetical protein